MTRDPHVLLVAAGARLVLTLAAVVSIVLMIAVHGCGSW